MVAAAEHALHDERDAQRVEEAVLLGDAPPPLAAVGEFGAPLQQFLKESSFASKRKVENPSYGPVAKLATLTNG